MPRVSLLGAGWILCAETEQRLGAVGVSSFKSLSPRVANRRHRQKNQKRTRTKTEEPEKKQGQRQKNQKKNKDKQTKSLRTMQYDAKTRRRARPEQVCELRHTRTPKPYTINQEPSLLNPETCISNLTNPIPSKP